jgi:uncharacterized membrane protein
VAQLIVVGFKQDILAVLRTVDPIEVAEQFRGYGGTVLQTTLTKKQSAKVQSIPDGRERRFASMG